MNGEQADMDDAEARRPFPQKAVVLGASGYGSELIVDPAPLNELLERGWTFHSATPMNVDVAGGGTTGVVFGAVSVLVIVEWQLGGEDARSRSSPTEPS